MLKAATPGPYTFLLPATRETPRRLQHESGARSASACPIIQVPRLLLAELGEPIMSSTLLLPGDELPLTDGREIREPARASGRLRCSTAAIAASNRPRSSISPSRPPS